MASRAKRLLLIVRERSATASLGVGLSFRKEDADLVRHLAAALSILRVKRNRTRSRAAAQRRMASVRPRIRGGALSCLGGHAIVRRTEPSAVRLQCGVGVNYAIIRRYHVGNSRGLS
jgi:hypothetical protein